jgi:outer membrane protein OmpA-like peptidoglycan-associated protein
MRPESNCELHPMKLSFVALVALLLIASRPAAADATGDELFRAADEARGQAEAAEAALLAPSGYAEAAALYERARRGYAGGAAGEAVAELLEQARTGFASARRNAEQARATLRTTLAAREAAGRAEAYRLAGSAWVRAEEMLKVAARSLEKSDVSGALKRADEAAALFDAAELQAIKTGLLGEARRLVAELGPAGTARMAPKTTARAQTLLQQAEAELDADRTRTDGAARIAAQAAGEARHAVALARFLRAARESDATAEDLVLEWEAGLDRTAIAAGTTADLGNGPREATDAVATAVGELSARAGRQAQDLQQRDAQIDALESEIRDLDGRLAGVNREAQSLSERLEVRERARQRVEQLEQIFPTDQAVVFRQGADIIVRVQGIAFAPGSAKPAASASPLLEKLRQVVAIYPRALYSVEGHTDSTGDSAANQRLSQSRAEAVRKYLIERLEVPAGRVTAIGYGDSRPVAKNDSDAGRRQNRRIDLVITPPE